MQRWAALLLVALPLAGCPALIPKSPMPDISEDMVAERVLDAAGETDRAAGRDGMLPPYDQWWQPADAGREPGMEDGTAADAVPPPDADTTDLAGLAWNCYRDDGGTLTPIQDFVDVLHTHSFLATGQTLTLDDPDTKDAVEGNVLYVYNGTCGLEKYNIAPEKVYGLQVTAPAALGVQVDCSSECYVYLMKNGCMYDSVVGCWWQESTHAEFEVDVLPAVYLVVVEFLAPEGFDPASASFDLHVAINYTQGDGACEVGSVARFSDVEDLQCPGAKTAAVEQAGTLSWNDVDDFFTDCTKFGVPADPVGGMPDVVAQFVGDFPGSEARGVDVEVEFPEGPPAAAGFVLSVTTDPCGAAAALLDCRWEVGGPLSVSGLSLFPGQSLYAVLDGMGDHPFGVGETVAYKVRWTVHEPCK